MGEVMRVGETVCRGQNIGEISLVEEMEAEVFVLEVEAAGLASGRRAEVVIEAQPDRVYPAKVKRVETVAKRRQQKSPTQYFGVILAFGKHRRRGDEAGPDGCAARLFLHEEDGAGGAPAGAHRQAMGAGSPTVVTRGRLRPGPGQDGRLHRGPGAPSWPA